MKNGVTKEFLLFSLFEENGFWKWYLFSLADKSSASLITKRSQDISAIRMYFASGRSWEAILYSLWNTLLKVNQSNLKDVITFFFFLQLYQRNGWKYPTVFQIHLDQFMKVIMPYYYHCYQWTLLDMKVTSGLSPLHQQNEIKFKRILSKMFSILFVNNISVISVDKLFSSFENNYFNILELLEKY